jgi:carbonic anhydrase
MISSIDALARLREGNSRFVRGEGGAGTDAYTARRNELLTGQNPFAVVLGCSDSRVPAEIIFDQGMGDLFVIRVAGNIVASSQIGSVEFAVEKLGARLVVVLGHTRCGAVRAAIESIQQPGDPLSTHLQSIVDRIRPSIESLLSTDSNVDRDALEQGATRGNVVASVDRLSGDSDVIANLVENNGLLVVGAEYSLESGEVEFF